MTAPTKATEKEGEFKTDLKNIVEIFAKSLYPEEDMFIRELIQNAHDSIVKRQVHDPMHLGRIDIIVDGTTKLLMIRDDGIGMTEQEILDYLCTIGGSGTRTFKNSIEQKNRDYAESLIGQFGIGILSAFVAADRIVIDTRHHLALPQEGIHWSVNPGENFRYSITNQEIAGTSVMLHLKADYRRFASASALKEIIKKYADFIPIPIYINGDGPQNSITAPWYRHYANEGERKRLYRDWLRDRVSDIPVEIIPVDIKFPYKVKGILYLTDQRYTGDEAGPVTIYQKRLFVCEKNRTLLPKWARFVRGYLDSTALNLTAARDSVRVDTIHNEVRDALGVRIISGLQDLAKEDPVRFRKILRWHQYQFKQMAVEHDEFFDAIADLVTFEVSVPEDSEKGEAFKMMTMSEYLAEQPFTDEDHHQFIFYISEKGSAAQFYRLCQAKGIITINANMRYDREFLAKYTQRHADQIVLERIDVGAGDFIFGRLSEDERREYLEMEHQVKKILGHVFPEEDIAVVTERFEPANLPAILTKMKSEEFTERRNYLLNHPGLPSVSFQELLADYLGQTDLSSNTSVLHLNARNSLVESLKSEKFSDPLVQDTLLMFYQNAFFYSQQQLSPSNLELMYNQTLRTLSHIVQLRQEVRNLQDKNTQVPV